MDNQTPEQLKKMARKEVRQRLAAMPPPTAERKSRAACAALVRLAEFRDARVVMAYLAIPGEVDTGAILARAWRDGKTVLLPKIPPGGGDMIALPCRTLDDPMVVGRYNIREPAEGAAWPVDGIDLVVVPALAYDNAGNRLGKGGGYYDRFLAQPAMRATTCGLAFTEQVIPSVCVQPHDRKVHLLVTDRGVLRFGAT